MPTRLAVHCAAASVAALSLLAAAGCVHRPASAARPGVEAWEARYQPAAGCAARVSAGRATGVAAASGAGGLVVRVTGFESHVPLRGVQVFLLRLGVEAPKPVGPVNALDLSSAAHTFAGLASGRYSMVVRMIGYRPRTDTVAVRADAADTVDVAIEESHTGYRNAHNCRPHGFRHAGQSACVTDSEEAGLVLDAARYYASPRGRRTFRLPAGDTLPAAALVRDEALCERAGRAYGGPGSPPRRVVVVAVGDLFVVYDPYEPLAAGEFDVWMVFDRRWRPLRGIAG